RTQMAFNVDWFPTVADLCDVPLPKRKIDGKSLVEVIGSEKAPSPHETFIWQSGGNKQGPQWAVREGDWKLLHNPVGDKLFDDDGDRVYLFNLREDVGEKKNLAAEHADVVKRLKGMYEEWVRE